MSDPRNGVNNKGNNINTSSWIQYESNRDNINNNTAMMEPSCNNPGRDNGRNCESFVAGFRLPTQQQHSQQEHLPHHATPMQQEPLRRRKMKKASKHRKRHIPVGPAGVWFQSQRQQQQQQSLRTSREDGRPGEDEETTTCDSLSSSTQSHSLSQQQQQQQQHPATSSASPNNTRVWSTASPAWTAAHVALGLVTCACPVHWTPSRRYAAVRPHINNDRYTMVCELGGASVQGCNDSSNCRDNGTASSLLLVQVLSVCTVNDHLWTGVVQDETGHECQVWIAPALVRQEQQRQQQPQPTVGGEHNTHGDGLVKPGHVWLLRNYTILPIHQTKNNNNNHHGDTSDNDANGVASSSQPLLLLVAECNIVQAWSPSAADSISNADYIQWMEARNTLTAELWQREDTIEEQPSLDDDHPVDEQRGVCQNDRDHQSIAGLTPAHQAESTEVPTVTTTAELPSSENPSSQRRHIPRTSTSTDIDHPVQRPTNPYCTRTLQPSRTIVPPERRASNVAQSQSTTHSVSAPRQDRRTASPIIPSASQNHCTDNRHGTDQSEGDEMMQSVSARKRSGITTCKRTNTVPPISEREYEMRLNSLQSQPHNMRAVSLSTDTDRRAARSSPAPNAQTPPASIRPQNFQQFSYTPQNESLSQPHSAAAATTIASYDKDNSSSASTSVSPKSTATNRALGSSQATTRSNPSGTRRATNSRSPTRKSPSRMSSPNPSGSENVEPGFGQKENRKEKSTSQKKVKRTKKSHTPSRKPSAPCTLFTETHATSMLAAMLDDDDDDDIDTVCRDGGAWPANKPAASSSLAESMNDTTTSGSPLPSVPTIDKGVEGAKMTAPVETCNMFQSSAAFGDLDMDDMFDDDDDDD